MTELEKLYNRQRHYARLRNKIFDSWWRYALYKFGFYADLMFRLEYRIDRIELKMYEIRKNTLYAHIPKDGLIMTGPITQSEIKK